MMVVMSVGNTVEKMDEALAVNWASTTGSCLVESWVDVKVHERAAEMETEWDS